MGKNVKVSKENNLVKGEQLNNAGVPRIGSSKRWRVLLEQTELASASYLTERREVVQRSSGWQVLGGVLG